MPLVELVKDFSARGSGINEFFYPKRPYLDEDGRLWVADRNNRRVKGVKPDESPIIVEGTALTEFVAKEGNHLVIGYDDKGIEVCNLADGHRREHDIGRKGDACFHNGKVYAINGVQDDSVYQLPEFRVVAALES